MEPTIKEKDEFTIVGLPTKVSLNDPGFQPKLKKLWADFIGRIGEIKNIKPKITYGLADPSNGIEGDQCSFEYVVGAEVSKVEDIPEGMVSRTVPKEKYAVFTHKDSMDKIGETYYAAEQWFKTADAKESKTKPFFEYYDERCKIGSIDSEFDIYCPLE